MWFMFLVLGVQRQLAAMRRKNNRPANEDGAARLTAESREQSQNVGLLCYILWTLFGTFFYAFDKGENGLGPLGFVGGFFMAVNVGYSIGLAPPIDGYVPSLWFSSFYIILGAFLITIALTYMGERVAEDASEHLFTDLKEREAYEEKISRDKPFLTRLAAFMNYNWVALMTVVAWIVWLFMMILYSTLATGWNFAEGQYFAVSTSSSAGNFSLPVGSPTWLYGATGIAAAVGVPVMAMAISSLAMLIKGGNGYHKVKQVTSEPVSAKELETLQQFGLDHSEGVVSKEEFVLLCMLRMGTEPGMVRFICDIFDKIERERGCVPLENKELKSKKSFMSGTANSYITSTEENTTEGTARMRALSAADLQGLDMLSEASETQSQSQSQSQHDEAMKNVRKLPSMVSFLEDLDDHWSERADDHSQVDSTHSELPSPEDLDLDPDDELAQGHDRIEVDLEDGRGLDDKKSNRIEVDMEDGLGIDDNSSNGGITF